MLKWLLRFFLLRVLPGRMILVLSLADLFFLLRSIRRRLGRPGPAGSSWQSPPSPQRSPRR